MLLCSLLAALVRGNHWVKTVETELCPSVELPHPGERATLGFSDHQPRMESVAGASSESIRIQVHVRLVRDHRYCEPGPAPEKALIIAGMRMPDDG